MSDTPLPATTTVQEDLTTASQRKVNLIWETTQSIIAITVVIATMSVGVFGFLTKGIMDIPNSLAIAFGTVIGFYFSRTNHAAIGGIGEKPSQTYIGR